MKRKVGLFYRTTTEKKKYFPIYYTTKNTYPKYYTCIILIFFGSRWCRNRVQNVLGNIGSRWYYHRDPRECDTCHP